jgi:hypothetical protein
LSIGDDSGGNQLTWTHARALPSATPLSSRAWSAALVDQRETADDFFVQNAHQVPRLFIAGADLVPQGLVNGAKLVS